MKRLASLIVFASLAMPVHAQAPADHPSCAPWKSQWTAAKSSADLGVMDKVIGMIPAVCPALKADAATGRITAEKEAAVRRAAAEKEAADQQAARIAAAKAADPCVQARNDWSYVQNASEEAVRTYRDSLVPACAVWRGEAQTKLNDFEAKRVAAAEEAKRRQVAAAEVAERERVAAEQRQQAAAAAAEAQQREAERVRNLVILAKATGIEGKWVVSKNDKKRCATHEVFKVTAEGNILITHGSADSSGSGFGGLLSAGLGTYFEIEAASGKTIRWSGVDRVVNGDEMQSENGAEKKYRCG